MRLQAFGTVALLLLVSLSSSGQPATAVSTAISRIREAEKSTSDAAARESLRAVRGRLEDAEDQPGSDSAKANIRWAVEELRSMALSGEAAAKVSGAISALEPPAAAFASLSTAEGLHSVRFDTLQGSVTVNLPDDLQAGDTISGSVITSPTGTEPAELAKNDDSLSGYVVEIDEQRTPASSGGGKWVVPALTAAATLIPVILRDHAGREVGRAAVPLHPISVKPNNLPSGQQSDLTNATSGSYQTPKTAQAGHPTEVKGAFDGDFSTTQIRIGGTATRILAESPRKAVFESPESAVGRTDIEVAKGNRTARCEYRNIAVKLSAPKVNLKSGERTVMTVAIAGAEGLDERINVDVFNKSSRVVHIDKGDKQTISFDPRSADVNRFIATRQLTGVMPGGFNIIATVLPPRIAMQPCATTPASTANTVSQPITPQGTGTPAPAGVSPVASLPAGITPRIPHIPEPPDDPDELRAATVAVHTGSQWRVLSGGRSIIVYRDNPPITGSVDLSGGSISRELPSDDSRSSSWRGWSRYFTFIDSDLRFEGSHDLTWNDTENNDGYLGVAPVNLGTSSPLVIHSNGLLLRPGAPAALSLQLRAGAGEPYSRRWTWQDVGDANGTVTLAPTTRLVAVTAIVVTEPQEAGRSILADRSHMDLWFDDRTVSRKPQYTSNEGMATLVLDRDPRPNWTAANFGDPDQGRDVGTIVQNVDEVWAYCGVHYEKNIQFRLLRYAEISSDVAPGCTHSATTGTNAYRCIGDWARYVRQSTGETQPSVPIVFVRFYSSRLGVAETFDSGIIIGQESLSNYGTNTIAHELGHFLGGTSDIFVDGSNSGTNLMHRWNGPSRDITLTREQCEAVWSNAADWVVR